jgi:hypothetical protein
MKIKLKEARAEFAKLAKLADVNLGKEGLAKNARIWDIDITGLDDLFAISSAISEYANNAGLSLAERYSKQEGISFDDTLAILRGEKEP